MSDFHPLSTPSVWKLTFSNSPSRPLPCCPPSDCQCLWFSTITYHGAQRYEQFLQVRWLCRALILLGLALLSSKRLCVFGLNSAIQILFFCLHPSLCLSVSWAWWDWPLTWLTNHRPSVLWHYWLGHVTRKTVSEMTYNVSSGTLNSTIAYLYSFAFLVFLY